MNRSTNTRARSVQIEQPQNQVPAIRSHSSRMRDIPPTRSTYDLRKTSTSRSSSPADSLPKNPSMPIKDMDVALQRKAPNKPQIESQRSIVNSLPSTLPIKAMDVVQSNVSKDQVETNNNQRLPFNAMDLVNVKLSKSQRYLHLDPFSST